MGKLSALEVAMNVEHNLDNLARMVPGLERHPIYKLITGQAHTVVELLEQETELSKVWPDDCAEHPPPGSPEWNRKFDEAHEAARAMLATEEGTRAPAPEPGTAFLGYRDKIREYNLSVGDGDGSGWRLVWKGLCSPGDAETRYQLQCAQHNGSVKLEAYDARGMPVGPMLCQQRGWADDSDTESEAPDHLVDDPKCRGTHRDPDGG